ncbi:MAG TPA: aminomethyl transferase family protein, partial [Rhizobiales bacterium]|nr:aminomethyl transferase family protein [Hyphomicrobiales bacterium]
EAGLERFVSLKKGEFIGREAALKEKENPPLTRIFLEISADDADCLGDEPIWLDGKVAGWVTSGGYAHTVGQSLAQGYLPTELVERARANGLEVEIIGQMRKARLQDEPPFDPQAQRMRS